MILAPCARSLNRPLCSARFPLALTLPLQVQPEKGKTSCNKCSVGYAQPLPGMITCNECPVGEHQPETGQSACLSCLPGSFTNKPAQQYCSACDEGKFQPAKRQTSCDDCPKGRHQDRRGQSRLVRLSCALYLCATCSAPKSVVLTITGLSTAARIVRLDFTTRTLGKRCAKRVLRATVCQRKEQEQ